LSVDDWIQAGFAILAAEGIKALKIDRLCRHLAVTKGSFYWHFTDIAAYRAAPVQAWGELRDEERRHFGELTALPPRERLLQMMSSLVSPQHWTLERAMREWARTDDAAAASVRAADQRVLAAVRQDLPGLRVRRRGRRGAGQRHIRRWRRLPAHRGRPARPSCHRRPRTLPRHHAQGLTARQTPLHTKRYGTGRAMPAVSAAASTITPEFVARLAERAQDAERLRQLAPATIDDLLASGLHRATRARPLRRQAGRLSGDPRSRPPHGARMRLQRVDDRLLRAAQLDAGAVRRARAGGGLCDASVPRARSAGADGPGRPDGRRRPADRPVVVGHRGDARQLDHRRRACGPEEDPAAIYPALALLRAGDFQIEDVWHTDGMRATGSNDVVITDAFVPGHRLVRVSDIYTGTAPGAGLHDADTYRWPMVPALALLAAMPAFGSAERAADLYAERLSQRVLA